MTERECAIVEAYTGICMLVGSRREVLYKYLQDLFGRPVYTHELADKQFQEEIKKAAAEDFFSLCRNAAATPIENDDKGEQKINELIELIFDKTLLQINSISQCSSFEIDERASCSAEHLAKTLYYLTNSPAVENYFLRRLKERDELDELLD